ncbi:3-deoxy-manno-octulosonate cytidylyltransferase [Methylocaldum marinum]|uniref:3-deoxy-manno-octulosonate cytidylyltransferase n=1 Tax=Methylocaldum marinum TaxID=1432792 RepID=A0A250KTI3_9GAMM|nr:3-deoxy-manno-octulosonate cytidylyltransferase [Methylocaldum marinum]BBA33099.1 3-deoxy-manno-octulosonate cytidylyltransferase [Methylocaldum marinum]
MPAFNIVIPARYGSSRLPGKPLLPLAGRPMIVHVCERALEVGDSVVVATDDERIREAVSHLPVHALMTREDHASGSERIAEVVEQLGWADDEIVVNLQGDEPLIRPHLIRILATTLTEQRTTQIATLATPIKNYKDICDPNTVKTVLDQHGYALYFSRAPIPWFRTGFANGGSLLPESFTYLRHIGVYAYSAGFLRRYVKWRPSKLETVEALEQLRILWHGERILVLPIEEAPEAGVDTEEDLRRVDRVLQSRRQPG